MVCNHCGASLMPGQNACPECGQAATAGRQPAERTTPVKRPYGRNTSRNREAFMAATAAAVDPERRASAMRADGTPCLYCGSIIPDGEDECPHCHRSRSGRVVAASGAAGAAASRRGKGAGAQRDRSSREHGDDAPKSKRDAGSTGAFTAVLGGAAARASSVDEAEPKADEAQEPEGAEDRKAEAAVSVSAAAAAAAAAMAERERGGAARGGEAHKRQPTRAKQPLSTPGRQKAPARSVVVDGLAYEEQRKKRLAALAGVAVVAVVGIGIIAGSAFLGSGATGEEQAGGPTEATQPGQNEDGASSTGKDKSVASGGTGAKGAESASDASDDSKDADDDAAAADGAADGAGGAEGSAGGAGAAGASGAASIWPDEVANAPAYAYDLPYYGGVGGSQGIPNASFDSTTSFGGGSASGGAGAGGAAGGALSVLEAETDKALAQAVARVEDYYLPDAQKRAYSRQELEQLSDFELYLARNEIYARHGRLFSVDVLIDYFNSRKWYDGKYTAEAFNALENVFNEFEVENIELVKEIERERASAYLRE